MSRVSSVELALRRAACRGPVKTRLAALEAMRCASAKWLRRVLSDPATHPKVIVRCVQMLRKTGKGAGIDPNIRRFLNLDKETK